MILFRQFEQQLKKLICASGARLAEFVEELVFNSSLSLITKNMFYFEADSRNIGMFEICNSSRSGVKSVQAEAFAAVAAEERALFREVSDAAQMVAAIESGTFTGDDRDPLDCDSVSDDEDGKFKHRPSSGTLRTRPKTSGRTELPVEVRYVLVVFFTSTPQRWPCRFMLLISFCAKPVASLLCATNDSPTSWRISRVMQGWDARDHDRCCLFFLLQHFCLTAAQVSARAKSVL